MNLRKTLLSAGIIAASLFAFVSCSMVSESERHRSAPVAKEVDDDYFSSAEVARGDVASYQNFRLGFQAGDKVSLRFGVENARITKSYVEVGDIVKEGDLLLECASSTLSNKLASLEADIASYQAEVDYYTSMSALESERKLVYASYGQVYDSSVLEGYEEALDVATKNLNISKLSYDELSEELEGCRLYATMDGVVSYIAKTSERNRLKPYDTAIIIVNEQAFFQCTTALTEYFEIGNEYEVSYYVTRNEGNSRRRRNNNFGFEALENEAEEETEQEVRHVDAQCVAIDVINDTSSARSIRLIPLEDVILFENGTTIYEINILTASAEDVLFIPCRALIKSGDSYVVYVQEADGSRSIRNVDIGVIASDICEVKGGLSLGETVLMKNNES